MIGKPELADDPRFADNPKRGEHGKLLSNLMAEWCATRTRDGALTELEKARIPAGPVYSPRQVLDDEVIRASQAFHWVRYPGVADAVPIVAPPIAMSRAPPNIRRRAPTAGEDTEEVLQELGYANDSIAELRKRGVV